MILQAMIINDSTYAISSQKLVGRPQNERNEVINNIGAETAANFLMKKRALTEVINGVVETQRFKDDFRCRIYDGSADHEKTASFLSQY